MIRIIPKSPKSRRGVVMFAVLFLVIIAALSAATLLTATAAERSATVRSLDELELRAAIRSALAVAKADLTNQRDSMLRGELPEAPSSVRIDRGEDAPGIVVEFIEQSGQTLIPEAGRLDLNFASADSLSTIPGLDESMIRAIESRRRTTPFRSPAELFTLDTDPDSESAIDGFDENPTDENQPLDEPPPLATDQPQDAPINDAGETESNDPAGLGPDTPLDDGPLADEPFTDEPFTDEPFTDQLFTDETDSNSWLESLTVFAAEPQIMVGINNEELAAAPKVNINAPWSDRLEQSLAEATGEGMVETVRTLFIDAPRLTKPSELVTLLVEKAVPVDQWAALIDAITTTADPYRLGLVDLNSASTRILAALPGIGAESAEAIADARERIDAADRLSITWPLDEGILSQDEFLACVDLLSVRCFQWRFTIRASFEPEGDDFIGFDPDDSLPGLLPDADEFGVEIEEPETETGPSIEFEVVIDLAGSEAKIAYLRERSAYGFAVAVASLPGFVVEKTEDTDDFFERRSRARDEAPDDDFDRGIDLGDPDSLDNPMDLGSDPGLDFGGGFDEALQPDIEPEGTLSSPEREPAAAGDSRDNRLGRWAPSRTRGNDS